MSKKYILQIVPYRSSAADGIGDYATGLAAQLQERHDIHTVFIAATPAQLEARADDGWPTLWVNSRSKRSLLEKMQISKSQYDYCAIILHVAGYGYQKRAVPIWLLQAMQSWRGNQSGQRLIGVFHELYATGRITNSAYWVGALQKYVARQLWLLCDGGLTTNSRYVADLSSWRPADDAPLALMPVPSNVGEPDTVPGIADRQPHALVFGRAGVEQLLYETHGQALAALMRLLGITKIIDIGSRHQQVPAILEGIPVEACGRLSAQEVSSRAQDCRFGLLAYDISRLGKSGVLAAYAANGVIPICVGSNAPPGDGLKVSEHFYTEQTAAADLAHLQSMQENIQAWYKQHNKRRLGECVASLCFSQKAVSRIE